MFFVAGILAGGFIAAQFFSNPKAVNVNPKLVAEVKSYGISDMRSLSVNNCSYLVYLNIIFYNHTT